MEKEVLSEKSPLFGRATRTVKVDQMLFDDVRQFFPQYDAADAVLAYSVLGGTPITVKIHIKSGNFSPIIKAIIILPKPEKHPFIVTISIGSLLLNIFVQLFSKPQQVESGEKGHLLFR